MPLSRSQSGVELLEFALVLPLLCTLLLVAGQIGAAIGTQQVLDNAAREGARLSATPGELGLITEVQNRVIAYAAANGITLSASQVAVNQLLVVSPTGGACSASNPCMQSSSVAVTYTYPVSSLLGASLPLGATVEMRNLY